jgi:stress-induced-phosphoprotein 1
MDTKKEQANNYFKEKNYEEAIKLYSEILDEDQDNYLVLSNRSASYIKLGQYSKGLSDATRCTKLKPEWGKAWGRLGGALHGQGKYNDALVAYNKANELEPSEIYQKMIVEIKDKINGFKCSLQNEGIPEEIKNFPMGQMYLSMFSSVTENPKLMEKLFNPEFQSKILSMQTNPTEMFKDKEIMGMLIEMIKGIKIE